MPTSRPAQVKASKRAMRMKKCGRVRRGKLLE